MKRLLAALGFMLLAPPAFATTIPFTPPVVLLTPGSYIACDLVNTGKSSIMATVDTLADDGSVRTTATCTLPPGSHMCGVNFDFTDSNGPSYARFTSDGSRRSVRAGCTLYNGTGQEAGVYSAQ
jgi:hypothetical protein